MMRAAHRLRVTFLCLLLSGTAYAGTNTTGTIVQASTNQVFTIKIGGSQTNLLGIAGTGLVHLPSGVVAWEDLRFPVSASSKFNPSSDVDINVPDNSITFETGASTNLTDDHVYGVAQFPHSMKLASGELGAHIHFWQDNADQTNMWYLRYKIYDIGEAVPASWTVIGPATNATSYSSGTIHQMAEFPDIDASGISGVSAIMDWKIYRDGNFGTGDIEYKEFDIHYQVDGFGSDSEDSKTY